MLLLGLDYARKLRAVAPRRPRRLEAGRPDRILPRPHPVRPAIPRFRLPFDPVFDLSPARSTFELSRALEVDPDDGLGLWSLAPLDRIAGDGRGRPAAPGTVRPAAEQEPEAAGEKAKVADEAAVRARLGPGPATRWANLSELEGVVAGSCPAGPGRPPR